MEPLVIVNPAARGGDGARDWPAAASALRTHYGAFACRYTEGPGDAVRIAREEATLGRRLLLTFGGDGTISETARGILESGSGAELGILPHGTGGDLARSLGIPARLADAARGLRRGRTVCVDVGRAVFPDGREKSFVNSASFGLSAEVARRVSANGGSYAVETLRAAAEFRFPEVELEVDGGSPRRARITTVSLHNGKYFGGGMKMAPDASLTDGFLDVVVVRKLPLGRLLASAPLLYAGAHLGLDDVEHGKIGLLVARGAIALELDGEAVDALPARFEVRPRALNVRLPQEG
jgi:YegS/Rv2252/BmrU family lipid kinase